MCNRIPCAQVKCMSFQKAIVVVTGRAHCFHDYMCMCVCNIYIYIYISDPRLTECSNPTKARWA